MKITIFPDIPETSRNAQIIKILETEGFVPLVDALHGKDLDWLTRNYQSPHRFFNISHDGAIEMKMVTELTEPPQMAIHFNSEQTITDFEWDQIKLYIVNLLYGNGISERTRRCINRLKDYVATPTTLVEPVQPTLPQFYEFNSKMLEDRDIAVFEIIKANTTTPYTTIIREFSVKGYKPLFTNYFACNAFRNDFIAIHFLMKLWEEFMQGPMDLDQMLMEATEACYPGDSYIPIAEPEVYMKPMNQVLELLGQ